MPRRRLHSFPLVALALLLLYAQPSAAHADELLASDETPEAGTITTVLQPGWNMVGWIGPATPTSELFEEIPALERVSAWDANEQQYQRATRDSPDGLSTLTPGMGLWLRLGGDSPVRWTRPAAPDGLVLRLRRGLNLVGVVSGGAVSRFSAAASGAWRWDPARQQYGPYRFGDPMLRAGDALWIQASAPVNWWQPGTAEPPFVFLGDVPAEIQSDILAEYERQRRFFAERFAAVGTGLLTYIGADREAIVPTLEAVFGRGAVSEHSCGRTDFVSVRVRELSCTYPVEAFPSDSHYVGALLIELAGRGFRGAWDPGFDPRGPSWLINGAREYAQYEYREAMGLKPDLSREQIRGIATGTELGLDAFEPVSNRDATLNGAAEALGFLAVEWLAERAGDPAVFEYFRQVRTASDWRYAFATAFGIAIEEFYPAFEAYRAEAFPPLPHLTDDLAEAALVFVEGVPADTRAAIQAEFDGVRRFFAERFEAEATEVTLYVAPDVESALVAAPGWHDSNTCNDWPLHGRAVITLQRCGSSPPLDYFYIGGLVRELAVASGFPTPPWLSWGSATYAEVAYREAAGTLAPGEYRESAVAAAARDRRSLQDLAAGDATVVEGVWPVKALGFLAVEWLAKRAGDSAVFEYHRQEPFRTGLEAAFESAFGLTLDDFYKQFEAYRATLRQ